MSNNAGQRRKSGRQVKPSAKLQDRNNAERFEVLSMQRLFHGSPKEDCEYLVVDEASKLEGELKTGKVTFSNPNLNHNGSNSGADFYFLILNFLK